MNLKKYIEQQLHPETIDDSFAEKEVAKLPMLQMSTTALTSIVLDEKSEKKEKKADLKAAAGSAPPTEPDAAPTTKKESKKLVREQAAAIKAKAGVNTASTAPATATADATTATPDAGMDKPAAGGKHKKKDKMAAAYQAKTTGDSASSALTPPAAVPAPATGVDAMAADAGVGKPADAAKATDTRADADKSSNWSSNAAIQQLEQAKLVLAVDSQRQLQEVLADFWNNHFNIDVKKKYCRVYKVIDDREVIRPHLWGNFRELLGASAKSPAMLFYLDNNTNSVAKGPAPVEEKETMQEDVAMKPADGKMAATDTAAPPAKVKKKKAGGINENYARELMELHTLGVDGGYTQKDVQEVARCFTGWTVNKKSGGFEFNRKSHDNGAKTVLGHEIPAGGGIKDGETVLDLLAASPVTAHHISFQLCQRFVSDNPPAELVDRVAEVFTKTHGNLREVTAAILTSPEFLSPASYASKVKSPFEFSVSAVRASGSTILASPNSGKKAQKVAAAEGSAIRGKMKQTEKLSNADTQSLNWHIYKMGQPLFACTPPTGYKETSSVWVSPGALIERLNFAMALTQQKVTDVHFNTDKILADVDAHQPDAVVQQCAGSLLQNKISPATRQVLRQAIDADANTVDTSKLIALIIGSPEFQRK